MRKDHVFKVEFSNDPGSTDRLKRVAGMLKINSVSARPDEQLLAARLSGLARDTPVAALVLKSRQVVMVVIVVEEMTMKSRRVEGLSEEEMKSGDATVEGRILKFKSKVDDDDVLVWAEKETGFADTISVSATQIMPIDPTLSSSSEQRYTLNIHRGAQCDCIYARQLAICFKCGRRVALGVVHICAVLLK